MKLVPLFEMADYHLLIDIGGEIPRIVGGYASDSEAYDRIPAGHDTRYIVAFLQCSRFKQMAPDPRDPGSTPAKETEHGS